MQLSGSCGRICIEIHELGFAVRNGTPYVYEKNLQGDIIAIKNVNGDLSYTYEYDEWGNVKNDDSYDENPFRYRGYYYDSDTGLYYCGSRYYDPVVGRFINANSRIVGGDGFIREYNMYSYCANNPVNKSVPSRQCPKWAKSATSSVVNIAKRVPIGRDWDPTNIILKTHVTTPVVMLDLGPIFGKVGFSTTTSTADHLVENKSNLFYFSFDFGNDVRKLGFGMDVQGWLGVEVGVSTAMNIYVDTQITPFFHAGISLGLDGVGLGVGFNIDKTSYDLEIKGGWGLILLLILGPYAIEMFRNGQSSIPAPAY